MRREGTAGSIVNILSMSAHGGQPFICAYSGSKGALLTLTKNIAFSLMRDHIRVNGLNTPWGYADLVAASGSPPLRLRLMMSQLSPTALSMALMMA